MTTVNLNNLPAQLPAVIELVRKGESVLVTENDLPLVRVSPVQNPNPDEDEDDERPWRGTYELILPPPKSLPLTSRLVTVERQLPEINSLWFRRVDDDE